MRIVERGLGWGRFGSIELERKMADKEVAVCEENSRAGDLGGGDVLSDEKS